jgi:hypothetical protein
MRVVTSSSTYTRRKHCLQQEIVELFESPGGNDRSKLQRLERKLESKNVTLVELGDKYVYNHHSTDLPALRFKNTFLCSIKEANEDNVDSMANHVRNYVRCFNHEILEQWHTEVWHSLEATMCYRNGDQWVQISGKIKYVNEFGAVTLIDKRNVDMLTFPGDDAMQPVGIGPLPSPSPTGDVAFLRFNGRHNSAESSLHTFYIRLVDGSGRDHNAVLRAFMLHRLALQ